MIHGNAPAFSWRTLAPAFAAVLSLALGACASTGQASAGARPAATASATVSGAQPTGQGAYRYKVGAPYEANGVWFVPAEQPDYKDVGLGAVYRSSTATTADGERFDAGVMSAAHATLPMPAMVEVTNLENGRRIEVRVNDRGATQRGQVIALSPAAADALGYAGKPAAKVQVRYLRPASLDANAPRMTVAAAPAPQPAPVAVAKAAPIAAVPIAPPAKAAIPVSAPTNGGFAVQAGAFSNRANAERVVAKLGSAGGAVIRPLERGGATLYRVVVGPWANEAAASAAREQVAALGFGDAKVVRAF